MRQLRPHALISPWRTQCITDKLDHLIELHDAAALENAPEQVVPIAEQTEDDQLVERRMRTECARECVARAQCGILACLSCASRRDGVSRPG